MRARSSGAAAVFLVVFLAGSFGTALAEGSRYSSMSKVYPRFNFRNFSDYNSDNVSTWASLGGCYLANPNYSPYSIQLNLWKVNNWAPDDNRGAGIFSYSGDADYWGDFSAGTYHFTLTGYNKDDLWYNPLTCNTVNYGW